jgi:sugar-specific transcriptional regulator TrmB
MIVQKDFINRLKEFGLNSYESKLWVALLSRGVSTAGELSDISNVPRSRAYDVLESLEKKGFIIVKVGKPIKYLAVPPREVIERVKRKVSEEAALRAKMLESLRESEILEELNTLHSKGIELIDPTERSGSFRGREKIYDQLVTMIKNAKKSVTIMTTAAGVERKAEALQAHLKKAAQRGVKVNIIVPSGAHKDIIAQLNRFATVTHMSKSNCRFCIVDGKEILFFVTDDKNVHKGYDSAVWVDAPYFVEYFSKLVDLGWKDGR